MGKNRKSSRRSRRARKHQGQTPPQATAHTPHTHPAAMPQAALAAGAAMPLGDGGDRVDGGASSSRIGAPSFMQRVMDWFSNPLIGSFVLAAMIGVTFFPTIGAGFLSDDFAFTSAQPVRDWNGLYYIWFHPLSLLHEGHYWPLTYTTFWLEHKIWGYSSTGYHIANQFYHAAGCIMLWRLLLHLGVRGAWLAAAIFALHPVHAESVSWIIGRKDILASFFYFATVFAYVRYMETGERNKYVLAIGLSTLGLLCKSVGLTLPLALLIWHWWKRGRFTVNDCLRVAPFFVIAFGINFADFVTYKSLESVYFSHTNTQRVLIAARALWFYFGKLIWPDDLAGIYTRWHVTDEDFIGWGALFGALAMLIVLWQTRKRFGRAPLAAAAFFTLTLSPVLGLVDYGYQQFAFVADRYQYLASTSVMVLFAASLAHGARKLRATKFANINANLWGGAQLALIAALLCIYGALSWRQAGYYEDSVTYYRHVISINPKARQANAGIGEWHQTRGDYEKALEHYTNEYELAKETSDKIRINKALVNIGFVYELTGEFDRAESYYRQAIRISPSYFAGYEQLGSFLMKRGRFREAIKAFRTVVRFVPWKETAYIGLGAAYGNLGRLDEAIANFDKALSINPAHPQALQNRELIMQHKRAQEQQQLQQQQQPQSQPQSQQPQRAPATQ